MWCSLKDGLYSDDETNIFATAPACLSSTEMPSIIYGGYAQNLVDTGVSGNFVSLNIAQTANLKPKGVPSQVSWLPTTELHLCWEKFSVALQCKTKIIVTLLLE